MEIIRIFDNCLFSFFYDNESSDEFERLFDLWQDPQYLFSFFTKNITDLNGGYYGTISVDEAVVKTIEDAQYFEGLFLELSRKSKKNQKTGLDFLFVPLDDPPISQALYLNKSKARKSWLRIYALRIEGNAYIITGGAIKLTGKMNLRRHTKQELLKLEKCRNYLLEQGITDIEGIIEEMEI